MVSSGGKRDLRRWWGLSLLLWAVGSLSGAPVPVGSWEFEAPEDLLRATVGDRLLLEGEHTAIPGLGGDDGAVRIGVGSHYRCNHGIAPNGTGTAVNQFTLQFDYRIPRIVPWYCFYQTDTSNQGDGDCFIRANDGAIGVGQTGYSNTSATPWTWQRLLVAVDNSVGLYRIYLDGKPILNGAPQAVDGRFSLRSSVLLFADENGEDAPIDITRIAIFDRALTAVDAVELGSPHADDPALVEFLTPPYLQNVKVDGMTILWECDLGAVASVDYGLDTTFGASQSATMIESGAGTRIYQAVLSGLRPGTTYHYRPNVGGSDGPTGSFTTAPAGTPAFVFGVWADSQGHNHGAYPADPLEPTKSMMRHLAASGVDFAVGVGDLAENGGSYSDTREYYLDRVARLLGGTVPWFVAWGNHDAGRGSTIRRFAAMPSQERPGFDAGYGSFSFDYAECHFICIDYASATSDIRTWLETDLQSAANRNARFTFLFVHVPPYCELWIDGDALSRNELVPLLEAYGVEVCFSGHTHEYSRGYRNGVHYCITGGGSWLDLPEVLVWDWDHMTVGGAHAIPGVPDYGPTRGGGLINEYVRVEVSADGFTASMIGFAPDGTALGVLDAFENTPEQGPLRITDIRRGLDGVDLEWAGPEGPYQIEFRPQSGAGTWFDLGGLIPEATRSAHLPADTAGGWYRIRLAR